MGAIGITNFSSKWSFVIKDTTVEWFRSMGILKLCFAGCFLTEKVGIPEFLNGLGNGVEAHVAKLESEIGDFQKLLVTRTLRLKKLGIPVKQVIHLKSALLNLWSHKHTIIHIEVCFL